MDQLGQPKRVSGREVTGPFLNFENVFIALYSPVKSSLPTQRIVGSEVMSPFADAMSFVDRQQANLTLADDVQKLLFAKPLNRGESLLPELSKERDLAKS